MFLLNSSTFHTRPPRKEDKPSPNTLLNLTFRGTYGIKTVFLTSDLLHDNGLCEGNRGAAASFIHSHHADLQAVTGGLVLDDVATGLLQFLIDCFPVISWMRKTETRELKEHQWILM